MAKEVYEKKIRKVYVCGSDWTAENWRPNVDTAKAAPEIFRSQAELKRSRKCWRQCGIVELLVVENVWKVRGTL